MYYVRTNIKITLFLLQNILLEEYAKKRIILILLNSRCAL